MSKPTIVKGEDVTLTFHIKKSDGSAYDLTGKSVEMNFQGSSSTVSITGSLSATPADGEITVVIDETNTALLAVGTINAEAIIDLPSAGDNSRDRRIVQFKQAIVVVERLT